MTDPTAYLPLQTHVFQILMSLSDGAKHGYTIIKDIRDRTEGEVNLGTSTLYSTIKRMLKADMVHETGRPDGEQSEDSRRRYYAITEFGIAVARSEAARVRRLGTLAAEAGLLTETVSGRAGSR